MEYYNLIELKYINKQKDANTLATLIKAKKTEARADLQQYAQDDYMQEKKGSTTLNPLILIWYNWELVVMEEL